MRIDQQRLRQLACGARESGQHEYARVLRGLGGDVLLGDQVHAVAHRRDQADTRAAIEPGEIGLVEAPVDIADRHPVRVGVAPIDRAGQLLEARAQFLVFGDVAARDRCNLHHRNPAAVLGIGLEEPGERFEAFGQALRVVESVHADGERASAQTGDEVAVGLAVHRQRGISRYELGIDADRECLADETTTVR